MLETSDDDGYGSNCGHEWDRIGCAQHVLGTCQWIQPITHHIYKYIYIYMYTAMLPRQHLHIQGHAATTYRWPCCHTIYTNMLLQHIKAMICISGFPKKRRDERQGKKLMDWVSEDQEENYPVATFFWNLTKLQNRAPACTRTYGVHVSLKMCGARWSPSDN